WRGPMERAPPGDPGGVSPGIKFPLDEGGARGMGPFRTTAGPGKIPPGRDRPMMAGGGEYHNPSLLAVAPHPKVDQPYMFGLHQCSYAREWSVEDENLFRAIGRRLTDSLTSLVAYRNLQESQRDLGLFRALIDRATDTIEVIDPKTGRFLDVNE